MTEALLIFVVLNLLLLFYIFFGYPLLLFILSYFKPAPAIDKGAIRPSVSLLISCYNEEKSIRQKMENALQLSYPAGKLQIVVISDGSTDRTDAIVAEFQQSGVRLVRQEGRLGKTCGLNLAMTEIDSDIVVFSDANAMYRQDAIIRLVENFNDPSVGYVVGEARYTNTGASSASTSENTYWQYEILIKKLESRVHSIVGGDGAIYAIRRELYEPLEQTDINDFVNPLQIIAKGYRGVYEPTAICYEDAAGDFGREFKRKTRIVNRSFSGILRVPAALNPLTTGLYSLQLLSHKVLRWFSGLFTLNVISGILCLAFIGHLAFQFIALIMIIFLISAYIGFLCKDQSRTLPVFYYPYYLILVKTASLNGILKSIKGSVQVTWEHHRITDTSSSTSHPSRLWIHTAAGLICICGLRLLEELLQIEALAWQTMLWGCLCAIIYTSVCYPALLYLWSLVAPQPIDRKDITPAVTLLICAFNEAEVIEAKILNSLEIDYPSDKLTIVIASDGSYDGTVEIVQPYQAQGVRLFDYPQRSGKTAVINKTIPHLSGDILVFSDANTMLEQCALRKIIRNFADSSVGVVSGDVMLDNCATTFSRGENLYYRYERFIQKRESLVQSVIGVDGGMFAIRRELFEPPPADTILDDFVISMNIALKGFRIVYEDRARGCEGNVNLWQEEFLRQSRVMSGVFQALKRGQGVPGIQGKPLFFCYLSHKFLRWFTPLMLVVCLVATIRLVLAGQSTVYAVLLIAQLLFILTALIGFLMKHHNSYPWLIVPFYLGLEIAAALFGMYKGLFNRQSVKWQKFRRNAIEIETFSTSVGPRVKRAKDELSSR